VQDSNGFSDISLDRSGEANEVCRCFIAEVRRQIEETDLKAYKSEIFIQINVYERSDM